MHKQWAEAVAPRHQLMLIGQSLDETLPADHPIRSFDAFLNRQDWRAWEAHYDGRRGQPPIHPRLIAGAILYGLLKGIRSTRALEEATRTRVDFMWFLEMRTIDHSTFAGFRVEFGGELKALNRAISRELRRAAGDPLVTLVIDGTRLRANSSRTGTATAGTLEKKIAQCEERLNGLLDRLEAEEEDEPLDGADAVALERALERAEAKRARLYRALETARARDAAKQEKYGKKAPAARVPVTDPEAMVLPNKDGGFAPNWTATMAVDAASGAILEADVVEGADECSAVAPAVEAAEEIAGAKPVAALADGNFASGANLDYLAQHGVEAYMPTGLDLRPSNPANRPDRWQPVAEDLLHRLPRSGGQFAQTAFLYNEEEDCYHCPAGRRLDSNGSIHHRPDGAAYRTYECPGAAGCPLAKDCVKRKAARRTVLRDQWQALREQTALRMAGEAGQALYRQRAPVAERPFGYIKQTLGIRHMLLRGREKVRTEWRWIALACNLRSALGVLQAKGPGAFGPRPHPSHGGPGKPLAAHCAAMRLLRALWRALYAAQPHCLAA